MDADFKDLLPWQEMSKRVKDLETKQGILEGSLICLHDLQKAMETKQSILDGALFHVVARLNDLESRTSGNTAPTESLAATRQTLQDI